MGKRGNKNSNKTIAIAQARNNKSLDSSGSSSDRCGKGVVIK